MKKLLLFGLVAMLLVSCGNNKKQENSSKEAVSESIADGFAGLNEKANQLFGKLPAVAENPENIITDQKIELGKTLYFDNRLSKDNTQSCNTCHNLNTYGVDNEPLSKGNDGGLGDRNSPTTLNAALHIAQFWDGRDPDVEAQAGGPILNPVEMAMPSEEAVIERLSGIPEYVELFAKAFPDDQPAITFNNLKKAIGVFERKLITPSKFDDYLAGNDNALNNDEKRGLQTYIDVGCTACHAGNLLGGNMYQKFGLFGNYWDYTNSEKIDNGKFDVTNNEADKYVFKVPSLRNIEKTYPYFHDGSVQDLAQAVSIMGKTQSNKNLTEDELSDIVAFLIALNGDLPVELKE